MLKNQIKKHAPVIAMISVLALIGIASVIGVLWIMYGQEPGTVAEIYQNGELVRTVALDGSEDGSFTLYGDDGSYNTIQVKDGKISVTDASCPDLLCVHMGETQTAGLPIVCLPNGLVIQVRTRSDGKDVPDAVAY